MSLIFEYVDILVEIKLLTQTDYCEKIYLYKYKKQINEEKNKKYINGEKSNREDLIPNFLIQEFIIVYTPQYNTNYIQLQYNPPSSQALWWVVLFQLFKGLISILFSLNFLSPSPRILKSNTLDFVCKIFGLTN